MSDEDRTLYAGDLMSDDSDHDATQFATPEMAAKLDPDATQFAPPISEHATLDVPEREQQTDDLDRKAERSYPTNRGLEMTSHAMAAVEMSTLFGHAFAQVTYGISPRYRAKLLATDRQSTQGGSQARQSILLHVAGDEKQSVVVGFVDSARNVAELRTYEAMHEIFQRRHKKPFDMVESEFQRLITDMQNFLHPQGVQVRQREESIGIPTPDAAAGQSIGLSSGLLLLFAVLLVGIVLGAALS